MSDRRKLIQLSNPHQYQALPGQDFIRLLRLSSTACDNSLELDLETFSLHERPSFRALSYTWSPKHPWHVVKCGGRDMIVGDNLWQCLNRLRPVGGYTYLWIDAICVNQKDLAERSAQVQLMRKIYASAESTAIWLGEGGGAVNRGIELMRLLSLKYWEEAEPERNRAITNSDLSSMRIPEAFDEIPWEGLDNLLGNSWFTRAWIIQEAAVSKHLHVHIGAETFDFDDLARAALFIRNHSLTALTGVDPGRAGVVADLRYEFQAKDTLNLPYLLIQARHLHATDPRDKVYAFLGLDINVENLALRPDYALSMPDVYIHTAKRLILQTKSLDLLSYADCGYRVFFAPYDGIPSWVPCWERRAARWLLFSCNRWKDWDPVIRTNSDECAGFEDADSTLLVSGVIVDSINIVSTPNHDIVGIEGGLNVRKLLATNLGTALYDCQDSQAESRRRCWQKLAVGKETNYWATGEPILNAYARTIVADSILPNLSSKHDILPEDASLPVKESDALHVTAYLEAWYGLKHQLWVTQADSVTVKDFSEVRVQNALRFRDLRYRATYRKRLVVSKQKRYMGLSQSRVRRGDSIVLLCGARTPFILRRTSKKTDTKENWKLMGGAYVHGLMCYGGNSQSRKDPREDYDLDNLRQFRIT